MPRDPRGAADEASVEESSKVKHDSTITYLSLHDDRLELAPTEASAMS